MSVTKRADVVRNEHRIAEAATRVLVRRGGRIRAARFPAASAISAIVARGWADL